MYYLEDIDTEEQVFKYPQFDRAIIKQHLFEFFEKEENQNKELWFYKVSFDHTTVGDTYLDTYVYRSGSLCKEIQKGNRIFYKKIQK